MPEKTLTPPKRYWFRAKSYGWGWTPSTWEGWLVTAIFAAVVVVKYIAIGGQQSSARDTLAAFSPRLVFVALVFLAICYKTGEPPRWRWGGKDIAKKS